MPKGVGHFDARRRDRGGRGRPHRQPGLSTRPGLRFAALALALTGLALLASTRPAPANHSATDSVSTGPNANGPHHAERFGVKASVDGRHVFFMTEEPLVDEDLDSDTDVYERFNGTARIVSVGPSGTSNSGGQGAFLSGISDDGIRVFFRTLEALVPADTDSRADVYDRSNDTTTLRTPGTAFDIQEFESPASAISRDGTRLFFHTREPLVPSDTDLQFGSSNPGALDVYESSGGNITLISTGPADPNGRGDARLGGVSADGTRVFFESDASLVSGDTDVCQTAPETHSCSDVYERSAGSTTLLSTGSVGGNANRRARFEDVTPDGSHLYFSTIEKVEPTDTDTNKTDVYERFGGATTLTSTGPADTGSWPACADGVLPPTVVDLCTVQASDDGSHVWFYTHEGLVGGDTGYIDIYVRSGNTTDWVSHGPTGGNAPMHMPELATGGGQPLLTSRRGEHAFFGTSEALVPEDTDSNFDIFERTGGVTRLVSTGPVETNGSPNAGLIAASEDGSRVIFATSSQMVASDPDGSAYDLFERQRGTTTLISTGPGDDGTAGGEFAGGTPDLTHVFFSTKTAMVSGDTDLCSGTPPGCYDIYDRRIAYATPRSASPIHVSSSGHR